MKVKKIIFVDNQQDAQDYIESSKSSIKAEAADILFIAMSPDAHAYLKNQGFATHATTDYFNQASHENSALKSKEIVSWIRNKFNFFVVSLPVRMAFNDLFIFWTRFSVHYCLWTIEIVNNCINAHQPEILIAPSIEVIEEALKTP